MNNLVSFFVSDGGVRVFVLACERMVFCGWFCDCLKPKIYLV